jgi:hypothetical protein
MLLPHNCNLKLIFMKIFDATLHGSQKFLENFPDGYANFEVFENFVTDELMLGKKLLPPFWEDFIVPGSDGKKFDMSKFKDFYLWYYLNYVREPSGPVTIIAQFRK